MVRAESGAHDGIVEDPLVHSSSLVSTRLSPPRSAARSSSAAASSAVAPDADDALVHSSSLVATRLSPAKTSAGAPPPSATPAVSAKAPASASPASEGSAKPMLYVSPTCPFAQRAWVAMLEKGVDFNLRLENLNAKSANLQDAYKAGTPDAEPLVAKVPVLLHDGMTLVESALVAEYVARAFPGARTSRTPTPPKPTAAVSSSRSSTPSRPRISARFAPNRRRRWTPPSTTFARGFDRRSARWPSRNAGRRAPTRAGRDSPSPTRRRVP